MINYIQIIEFADGTIWLGYPAPMYQQEWANTQQDNCPAPRSLAGRTDFTIRAMSYADFKAITDGECPEQLYMENGRLTVDVAWERQLMYSSLIKEKHLRRLHAQLDEELAREELPDMLKIARLQRTIEKVKMLHPISDQSALYQIARDSLKYAEKEKPEIAKKLDAIIALQKKK